MWIKQGARKEPGEKGRFAVFNTPQEGLRALAVQLKRYANAGKDSIYKIIKQYAPSVENDTASYIRSVERALGVGFHTRLNFSDPRVMAQMMKAIIKMENGRNPYSDEMIKAGALYGVRHQGKWGGAWIGENLNAGLTPNSRTLGKTDTVQVNAKARAMARASRAIQGVIPGKDARQTAGTVVNVTNNIYAPSTDANAITASLKQNAPRIGALVSPFT